MTQIQFFILLAVEFAAFLILTKVWKFFKTPKS
jgi:hypothetical protein